MRKFLEKVKLLSSFQLLWLLLGIFLVPCQAFAPNEIYALSTFKEGIYEDPYLVLSNWSPLDGDPCDWFGITCSFAGDHVIKINISGFSLKGFIAPELNLLFSLQELILHGNSLVGTIPKEIGLLKNLKVLDLGYNLISGPIPPEIGNLTSIRTINLQSNGLTGRLPPELGKLKYLEELRLDRNKLRGMFVGSNSSDFSSSMPGMYVSHGNTAGFCRSPQLKVADFSYNFFVGSIPKCLDYLPKSSFQGNCLKVRDLKQRSSAQCGGFPPAQTRPGVSPDTRPVKGQIDHRATSRPAWLLSMEVVTGIMVGSIFIAALFTAVHKFRANSSMVIHRKKSDSQKDSMTIYEDSELLKDVTRFSREELEEACEDFSNIIGSSQGSIIIYKGTMKGGCEIALISVCVEGERWTDYLELYFQREVADLAKLNHENTGKLLGYCRENDPFTRMLVFEYASNGTLYEHLHYGEGCQLSWTRRMNIVLGIARGLKYLHAELDSPFTISDLSSTSVYLTEDFSPTLIDFESWKSIIPRSETNSLVGRHLDVQGNIYAFGVLLLEIISGRPAYCKEKGCLLDWAKEFLDTPEVISYIVDPVLKHFRYEDLKAICEAVILCIYSDPNTAVSMEGLCSMLENRIDTSVSGEAGCSSLAWAELLLLSQMNEN